MAPSWPVLAPSWSVLGRVLASQKPPKMPPRGLQDASQDEVQHRPQLGSLRGPKNLIKRLRKSKKNLSWQVNGKRVQNETWGDHVLNLFDPFKFYILLFLAPSWAVLALLGASWRSLGPFECNLGPSWHHLGTLWAYLNFD